jgi:adenylyl-sulfate kinase
MEHKGFTLWLTGLPCSGKTTLADIIAEELRSKNYKVERLDGDIVRKSLSRDLGFTQEDREKNLERVIFVSKLLSRNGIIAITSFVSPYCRIRSFARSEIKDFIEVFVKCPVELCIKRDVKGMYKKALNGEIENFTGVSHPYEDPKNPEIVVNTDKQTQQESADIIIKKLQEMKYLDSLDR